MLIALIERSEFTAGNVCVFLGVCLVACALNCMRDLCIEHLQMRLKTIGGLQMRLRLKTIGGNIDKHITQPVSVTGYDACHKILTLQSPEPLALAYYQLAKQHRDSLSRIDSKCLNICSLPTRACPKSMIMRSKFPSPRVWPSITASGCQTTILTPLPFLLEAGQPASCFLDP